MSAVICGDLRFSGRRRPEQPTAITVRYVTFYSNCKLTFTAAISFVLDPFKIHVVSAV